MFFLHDDHLILHSFDGQLSLCLYDVAYQLFHSFYSWTFFHLLVWLIFLNIWERILNLIFQVGESRLNDWSKFINASEVTVLEVNAGLFMVVGFSLERVVYGLTHSMTVERTPKSGVCLFIDWKSVSLLASIICWKYSSHGSISWAAKTRPVWWVIWSFNRTVNSLLAKLIW